LIGEEGAMAKLASINYSICVRTSMITT
jgi:hypothetical protein